MIPLNTISVTISRLLRGTIAAIAVMTLPSLSVKAQNLSTSLKGQRLVTPVEREATRLSGVMPMIFDPVFQTPKLTVAEYTSASKLTNNIIRLEPAAWLDTIAVTPWKGYASIGYFPAYNLGVSAGYRFINTDRTRLSGWFQFDGFSYKGDVTGGSDLSDDTEKSRQSFSSNTATVGFDLDHRVDAKSHLRAKAGLSYAANSIPSYGKDFKSPVLDLGIGAGWWSSVGILGYHVDAAVDRFAFNADSKDLTDAFLAVDGIKETRLQVGAGAVIGSKNSRHWGGLEVNTVFLFDAGSEDASSCNRHLVHLLPYFGFGGEKFQGRLGVNIDFVDGESSKTNLSPEVLLNWTPNRFFALYAKAQGGTDLNTLRDYYNYCQFVNPFVGHTSSNVPLDLTVGFNIGPYKGFSFGLFGGYSHANLWQTDITVFGLFGKTFSSINNTLAYTDLNAIRGGAEIKYDWRDIVSARVAAEVTPRFDQLDEGYYKWRDRANFDLTADITVKPIKPLSIGLSYNLRTGRHTFGYDMDGTVSPDVSNIHELSLGRKQSLDAKASYKINEQFTVFVNVENILNQQYQLLYNIPSRAAHGLIGVSCQF